MYMDTKCLRFNAAHLRGLYKTRNFYSESSIQKYHFSQFLFSGDQSSKWTAKQWQGSPAMFNTLLTFLLVRRLLFLSPQMSKRLKCWWFDPGHGWGLMCETPEPKSRVINVQCLQSAANVFFFEMQTSAGKVSKWSMALYISTSYTGQPASTSKCRQRTTVRHCNIPCTGHRLFTWTKMQRSPHNKVLYSTGVFLAASTLISLASISY